MKRKAAALRTTPHYVCNVETWLPTIQDEAIRLSSSKNSLFDQKTPQELEPLVAPALSKEAHMLLNPTLTHQTNLVYKDATEAQKTDTSAWLDTFGPVFGEVKKTTGALPLEWVGPVALKAYFDIIHKLKTIVDDKCDIALDVKGETVKGGFHHGYYIVNAGVSMNAFDVRRQNNSIFPLVNKSRVAAVSTHLGQVAAIVEGRIKNALGKDVFLSETHLCFGFSRYAHFDFHQDVFDKNDCHVTALMQLSPGKSSIQVAGCPEPFQFTGPGEVCLFPCKVWHRSGNKERRTLTASFFFKFKDEKPKPSSTEEAKPDVKPEVKPEVEPEVKSEGAVSTCE